MGNRALVIFHDRRTISPSVYLHWHGDRIPGLLRELARHMKGRFGDAEYAAARFTGICHTHMPGNLSLGIKRNQLRRAHLDDPEMIAELSPGDASVIVVDTLDFSWRAHAGYLAEWAKPEDRDSATTLIEPPPDPDGIKDMRAEWAGNAVAAFQDAAGADEESVLCDLLCDLMHWADRENYDFEAALLRGRDHYAAETSEEVKP